MRGSQKIKIILLVVIGITFLIYLFFPFPKTNFSLSERISHRLLTPVAQGLRNSGNFLTGLLERYVFLRGVAEENVRLKEEVKRLRVQWIGTQEEQSSNERQRKNGEGQGESSTLSAKVIAFDPLSRQRSVLIDRGRESGIREEQTVLSQGGLVGRVVRAGSRRAQVLLITDPISAVDVLDANTRAQGTLVGRLRQLDLGREVWLTQAEYLDAKEEVRPGDLLLTSGMDGVFPKGIPAGVVRSVEKDANGLFQKAEVVPYVEMNKLEEVVVLKSDSAISP